MKLSITEQDHFARLLAPLKIELDAEQPHISGERFLMQKDKLVLIGDAGSRKVIIKTSSAPAGMAEIRGEKAARDLLGKVSFARESILLPEELYFGEVDGQLFLITEYIPQEKGFIEHALED